MQIRTRLMLQFLVAGGIIMIVASVAIYYSSASFRQDDFYNRLRNKARSTAKLLFDAKVFDPGHVKKLEKDNPANLHNERIIIINYLNDTVYSTDDNKEISLRPDVLQKVRLAKRVFYSQGPYEVLGTLYFARLDRYVVVAAAIDIEGLHHLEKLRVILTVVCIFSLLLFCIAGWFYSGRALKPISEVIRNVEDISITSLNLRVNEGNGRDEIGQLAKTFNRMLDRLETAFSMQKDFIAHASHELRTPLTSINGQLEVLLMKDRSGEEYKAALSSVLDDIKSLVVLANRLLLIARTRAEGPVNFHKKVRVDEILWQVQEETQKFNSGYHVHVFLDQSITDSDQVLVVGDESLLKVAISNIIDNACKYSSDHAVDVRLQRLPRWVEMRFEDRGIGIPEEDRQKIFEPFFRGTNAHSFAGSGIGLPLVNQIIKNHNGTISLSSELGKGTRFKIQLPASD